MADILQCISVFLEKKENIYGIEIKQTSTKDTILIATKSVLQKYPTTADIYNAIDILKKYLSGHSGSQTGFPLVNITPLDSVNYQLMVAIPINKVLAGSSKIIPKRMVPGSFLVSEVKGGDSTINRALNEMKLYMNDYRKNEIAIPFQILETDRSKEADTSKWITKIYYPTY